MSHLSNRKMGAKEAQVFWGRRDKDQEVSVSHAELRLPRRGQGWVTKGLRPHKVRQGKLASRSPAYIVRSSQRQEENRGVVGSGGQAVWMLQRALTDSSILCMRDGDRMTLLSAGCESCL